MAASASPVVCSICLDEVSGNCGRTVVTLKCSDKFHLDCIGSAFNAKGLMECPNCQAVENGVWRLFENGSPQKAQNVDQDTNYEYDDELGMDPEFAASPIYGLVVQQPSSGYHTANDHNGNLASTFDFNCQWNNPPVPNNGSDSLDPDTDHTATDHSATLASNLDFNCQWNDPPMPDNGFDSLNPDNQWNGLPVLTDHGHSQLRIARSCPFRDQGYISTMCGHMSDSDLSLLLPVTPVIDPANFILSFNDPSIYSLGFDFESIFNDPFTSTEDMHLNSSPSLEMLDSMVAGIGNANDQASTSNSVPFGSMVDQSHLHSPAASPASGME